MIVLYVYVLYVFLVYGLLPRWNYSFYMLQAGYGLQVTHVTSRLHAKIALMLWTTHYA